MLRFSFLDEMYLFVCSVTPFHLDHNIFVFYLLSSTTVSPQVFVHSLVCNDMMIIFFFNAGELIFSGMCFSFFRNAENEYIGDQQKKAYFITMSHGPAHSIGLPNAKPVLVFFRACSNFVSLMCVYVGRPSLSIYIHEKENSNKYQICGTKVQFLFFLNINQRINKICLFLIMQMRKLNMEKSP